MVLLSQQMLYFCFVFQTSFLILPEYSAFNTIFSILFNLPLANKVFFLCLYLFDPIAFKNILAIPLVNNTRMLLGFAIPVGVRLAVVK